MHHFAEKLTGPIYISLTFDHIAHPIKKLIKPYWDKPQMHLKGP